MMQLLKQLRSFFADKQGVAAVEFALVLPLLLTLYLGSVEASRALTYDRKLTSAASTLGDLVSQTKTSLPMADLMDYFEAAELTMSPYNSTGLSLIVSCVYVDAAGDGTVVWSYDQTGASGHAVDDPYDLPSEFTNMATETYVIIAESELSYSPLTSYIWNSNIPLYKEYIFVPRFGNLISIT